MDSKAHKHAALMIEYARSALRTQTPWADWMENRGDGSGWRPCHTTPTWEPEYQYRKFPISSERALSIAICAMLDELPEEMRIPTVESVCRRLHLAGYRKEHTGLNKARGES